ncbi:MAG: hypothetical protein HYX97_05645 [Chloroflexi bacterium]|nr:hypothetical protein [Chloroflexota bacterium]
MPTKFDRQIEEIIRKSETSGPRIIQLPSRWKFWRRRMNFKKKQRSPVIDARSLMPLGFLFLLVGLVIRTTWERSGTILAIAGGVIVVLGYLGYLRLSKRRPTGYRKTWRGQDVDER